MGFDDEMAEFKKLQQEEQKKLLTPGCVWATVKSVDWDKKTMTAVGIEDDLEYFEVQLGLGSWYRKPVINSKVMLGVPGLQSESSYIIECEEFDEGVYVSGESTFIIKDSGFIVQQGDENLRNILLDFMAECKKIVVVNGMTIDQAAVTLIEERLKTVLLEN